MDARVEPIGSDCCSLKRVMLPLAGLEALALTNLYEKHHGKDAKLAPQVENVIHTPVRRGKVTT